MAEETVRRSDEELARILDTREDWAVCEEDGSVLGYGGSLKRALELFKIFRLAGATVGSIVREGPARVVVDAAQIARLMTHI